MQSVFQIMIDDGCNLHKLVTQFSERDSLKDLRIKVLERGLSVCHFIASAKGEIRDVFKHPSVLWSVEPSRGSSVPEKPGDEN